jgi:c(7)-type cytochrome triheme protein
MLSFLLVLTSATSVTAAVGGGKITFVLLKAGNVSFSHDGHVSGNGLKCSTCHYRYFKTVEQHRKVTMADMEKGESCGLCHNGKKAFDVRDNCKKCHA